MKANINRGHEKVLYEIEFTDGRKENVMAPSHPEARRIAKIKWSGIIKSAVSIKVGRLKVPAEFKDDLMRIINPKPRDWWYCMHGHIFSNTPPADKPKVCPACEDIEHLRKHRQNLVAAADVVLDQIDSAGNVPLIAAFDGRELKNLRDAIAEARKDSSWPKS